MKKILILAIILLPVSLLYSIEVNIILTNGTVVKGNMLGKTAGQVFLDGENGKAASIDLNEIKSVFDASTGAPVDIKASASAQKASTNLPPQPQLAPVPGSDVYYYYYNGEPLYFYSGFWWMYGDGIWFRAPFYTGPWIIIGGAYVPGPVFYIGPRWHYFGPRWNYFAPHGYFTPHGNYFAPRGNYNHGQVWRR
jgi:hypothetical protein